MVDYLSYNAAWAAEIARNTPMSDCEWFTVGEVAEIARLTPNCHLPKTSSGLTKYLKGKGIIGPNAPQVNLTEMSRKRAGRGGGTEYHFSYVCDWGHGLGLTNNLAYQALQDTWLARHGDYEDFPHMFFSMAEIAQFSFKYGLIKTPVNARAIERMVKELALEYPLTYGRRYSECKVGSMSKGTLKLHYAVFGLEAHKLMCCLRHESELREDEMRMATRTEMFLERFAAPQNIPSFHHVEGYEWKYKFNRHG